MTDDNATQPGRTTGAARHDALLREPLDLSPIRARAAWYVDGHDPTSLVTIDDVRALIAEIERLQALLELTHKGLESLERHTAKVQEALTSLQRGDDELRAYLAWLLDPRLTAADFEIVLMWRIADYPPPSRLLGGGPVRARPLPDDGSHR